MEARAATPTATPSSRMVLLAPEATPRCCSVTLARAIVLIGAKVSNSLVRMRGELRAGC